MKQDYEQLSIKLLKTDLAELKQIAAEETIERKDEVRYVDLIRDYVRAGIKNYRGK